MKLPAGAAVLSAERIITPDQVHSPGWLVVDEGHVAAVGSDRSRWPALDLGSVTVAPGFVDLHCHGGNGASFSEGSEAATRALGLHRRHGTTSLVASLATDKLDALAAQVQELAALVSTEELIGVHLEGPWLSELHPGAHDASLFRDPDPKEVSELLDSLPTLVVMVTLAPERSGGLESVRRLTQRGVLAAIGHSDASFEVAQDAVDAGASVATHLFNAERALHHREPGLVLANLERDEVTVELIADGVHLHPSVVRATARRKPSRFVLITDAGAATGCGDGDFEFGARPVRVTEGVARLRASGVLAGSLLTLDVALRHAVQAAGIDLVDAVASITRTPADLLGRRQLGRLEPGSRADLVVLDGQLHVLKVMRNGRWCT